MKARYKVLLAAAAVMSSFTANAQQTRLLTADKHNEYGLVYTLPQTALEIEVTATRTVEKAGPYFQYAKKYIGTDDVVKTDSEKWSITEVKVTPYGVADKEEEYLMQLKPGALTYICVGDDSMIAAINKDLKNAGGERPARKIREKRDKREEGVDMNEYLQYVNEDFIASQSSAKRAQMLAENMMEIREAKVALTRGTAETMPTDGKQLELMLNSLARQEAAMTAAFCGITQTETFTNRYTFMPSEEGKSILFRMSDFAGFVDADDLSGDPVYLNVEITREGELPVDAKGEEKKLPKDAVMYNIPGAARISISIPERTLFEKEMDFAQFGVKFGLNPSLFSDKKSRSYAIFDTVTGTLKEIGEDVGE